MPTTRCLSLAPTMGMIDGVHGHTSGLGALALPATAARLSYLDQLGFGVANLTDSGSTIDRNPSHFGAGEAEGSRLSRCQRSTLLSIGTLVLGLLIPSAASTQVIHACVTVGGKAEGRLRIVSDPSDCKSPEGPVLLVEDSQRI